MMDLVVMLFSKHIISGQVGSWNPTRSLRTMTTVMPVRPKPLPDSKKMTPWFFTFTCSKWEQQLRLQTRIYPSRGYGYSCTAPFSREVLLQQVQQQQGFSERVETMAFLSSSVLILTVFSFSFTDYLQANSLSASLTRYTALLLTNLLRLKGTAEKAASLGRQMMWQLSGTWKQVLMSYWDWWLMLPKCSERCEISGKLNLVLLQFQKMELRWVRSCGAKMVKGEGRKDMLKNQRLWCVILARRNVIFNQNHWHLSIHSSVPSFSQTQSSSYTLPIFRSTPVSPPYSERRLYPSVDSSKISSSSFYSRRLSPKKTFLLGAQSSGGGKKGSMQILKDCSRRLGMILARRGELSYRQGLVLISMSQGFIWSSIMKSMPRSQKLCYLLLGSRFRKVDRTAYLASSFILGRITEKKYSLEGILWFLLRQLWNFSQLILLPFSYLPYSQECFWMASLVRWMQRFVPFLRLNCEEEVLMQPSGYQQALMIPLKEVSSMQWRMSNFLPLQSRGFYMYFWRMKVLSDPSLFFSLAFSRSRMSYRPWQTVIPLPLLLFSPGFMIQIFFTSSPLLFLSSNYPQLFMNSLNSASSSPLAMWKVRGSASNTSLPCNWQYLFMLQKSAFLLPMQQFCYRWL